MESLIVSEPVYPPEVAKVDFQTETDQILRASILGVRFHCLSLPQTLAVIDQFISKRQPRMICLSNAYTLALTQKDLVFKTILNQADLLLADGMSIVWGARWVSVRLPGRVAGPDLMNALCAKAPSKHYRLFLLGSTPENLEKLVAKLKNLTPELNIVGTYSPPMCEKLDSAENERILTMLHECKPDILFVGLSAPKQEKWIAEHLDKIQVPVCMGVGAAFDFLSGRIPRAPLYMQNIGLEWLYRLWKEPKRLWRRYLLGNVVFLSLLIKELFFYKLSRLQAFRP